MKKFLLSVSFLAAGALAAEDTSYWVEPCTNPETSCVAGDVQLARWALEAWQAASGGRPHFAETKDRSRALIRLVWTSTRQGVYGETVRAQVNRERGAH